MEASHGSCDVPISPIKQSCPMVCNFPSRCGDQTQSTIRVAGRMQPVPPPRCTSLLPNHCVPTKTAQPSIVWTKTSSHQGRQGSLRSAKSRRSHSDPCASYQSRAKGPVTESRGPGKWPQAGSEELFLKVQLKCNAHSICISIYLLLTGKCNTKANYLIKALGRVLMSQTSKQISKPLFCLRLQIGAGCIRVGWETQGPFHV